MSYLKSNITHHKQKALSLHREIESTCKAASVFSEELEDALIEANLKAIEAFEHLQIALDILTNITNSEAG